MSAVLPGSPEIDLAADRARRVSSVLLDRILEEGVLRCCCGRCAGGVTYLHVADYLADHQLRDGEYVGRHEVTIETSRAAHPSSRLASIDRRSPA